MHLIAAFAALGLLIVVLFPFVSRRLRAARRGRAVHLGGSCHWYANYDDELRYEPKRRSDIVRLTRSDLLARGYRPTDDLQVVPRTFRHRVPGDRRIRLWRSKNDGAPALWLCEWAADPVRVAIGVGERERVPGVESIPVPDGEWDGQADGASRAPGAVLGEWPAPGFSGVAGETLEWDAPGQATGAVRGTSLEPSPDTVGDPVQGGDAANDAVGSEAVVQGVPAGSERGRKRRRRGK